LVETLAEGLPVELDAAVSRVDHSGRQIRLETTRGTVTASRVIVTVPTSIIAAERLRFEPLLPKKLEAAAGLPLGVDDKLFISLPGQLPGIEGGAYLIGSTTSRETMSYQVRPFDRPAIYCFFGGRFAAALEREGEGAMFSFATGELVSLFGSNVRRHLAPLASSAWLADPWARGSYSYALPGHADDRAVLGAPVDGRLFFAGEATSANFFSTAHGAYISGLTAAEAALASLRRVGEPGLDSRKEAAAK
jgi:monoamine oxidase